MSLGGYMSRTALSFALLAATVLIMPAILVAESAFDEAARFRQKMLSHQEDFLEISKNTRGSDVEIVINLIDLAREYVTKLDHFQDLLLIQSLVGNAADGARIGPIIRRRVAILSEEIELSIKQVNLNISHLRSPAVLSGATQLRADLRELRQFLVNWR
jgi:hypothetical protein